MISWCCSHRCHRWISKWIWWSKTRIRWWIEIRIIKMRWMRMKLIVIRFSKWCCRIRNIGRTTSRDDAWWRCLILLSWTRFTTFRGFRCSVKIWKRREKSTFSFFNFPFFFLYLRIWFVDRNHRRDAVYLILFLWKRKNEHNEMVLIEFSTYFRLAWPLFSRKPFANWKQRRKKSFWIRFVVFYQRLTGLLSIFSFVT